jgi:DNA-binding transcriptional LysR family regulator
MIDLFFLKTFVAITKTNSFRIAAERNHISQPAVSQHIQILEKKLNTTLFERHGKKVTLTSAGTIFLTYAESILKQYEDAKNHIHEMDNKFNGTIRIATIYSVGLYELQPVIRKFFKKYPKINLHLEYQPSASIYEMIFNRTIDFGLVAYPQERAGIVSTTFTEDTLVVVQSPDHPTIAKKRITLKQLAGAKYIAYSKTTPTGKFIGQFFRSKGILPNIVHEYDNVELIKNAAVLGLGHAILPKNTIKRELKEQSLEMIHVIGFDLKRPLGILHAEKKTFTGSTKAFYETLVGKDQQPVERALLV